MSIVLHCQCMTIHFHTDMLKSTHLLTPCYHRHIGRNHDWHHLRRSRHRLCSQEWHQFCHRSNQSQVYIGMSIYLMKVKSKYAYPSPPFWLLSSQASGVTTIPSPQIGVQVEIDPRGLEHVQPASLPHVAEHPNILILMTTKRIN